MLGAVLGGAFLGGLADRMKENREYVREKSDAMQEYLWQAGLERQQEVKKARNVLTKASDYLEEKGLNKDSLLTLLDEDPSKVLTLYEAAVKAEEAGTLTSTILNSAVQASTGYSDPSMTPAELIKRATPIFVEGTELKKPEKEKSVLQKIFAPTTSEELMYDVYSSEIMGTRGADIQASVSAPLIRERTGKVKTDIGVFADEFGYTEINRAYETVKGKFDTAYKKITDQAFNLMSNNNVDINTPGSTIVTAQNGVEFTVDELREISSAKQRIDKLLDDGDDYQAYQEIIKLNPSLAKTLFEQGGVLEEVFTSTYGFGLDQSFLDSILNI